ncbi:MAG: DUF805 domain-containing protein [Saprospiraceae bacterium]
MEWYLKVVRDNYANFDGRARRQEYWMYVLFNALIIIGLCVVAGLLYSISETLGYVGFGLVGIYYLAILVPSLAVIVRRLQDQNRSGWMALLMLIPYIGGIVILVFMCLEGTQGPNEYGPDPKNPAAAMGTTDHLIV